MNIDPKKTGAIVIGIEKYKAGQSWNLNGPAHDACKFAKWLYDRQVPPENITLFISSLTDERLTLPNGLSPQAATSQNISQFIEDTLPNNPAELLFFYWGGHGVITTEGERRLFYADATVANKKNLDLNALLTFLRTDYFNARALSRQIVIVDTCANYVENMGAAKELPQNSFSKGDPLENREQYVLMAAKPGELAKNLDAEKTGLFTKELMAQLAHQAEWPPKMEEIRAQLSQRFEELREIGQAEQTPTYYYYRNWDSNEGVLGQVPVISNKPISSFLATKIALLEKRLNGLQKRYNAVFTQQEATLNEGDKYPLNLQLEQLQKQIQETETELSRL